MKAFAQYFCSVLTIALTVGLTMNEGIAQPKVPRISQGATVTQRIGLTDITVSYHRPGVKEREIWGKLLPFEKVWRAGANEATTVGFGDDVAVAGKQLKAGLYSFFVIPRQGEWIVIFNSQAKQWGAFSYDSTKDVLRIPVKAEAAPHEEWLSYSFSDLTLSSAKLVLRWEKIALPIPIEVNTDSIIASTNNAATTTAWQNWNTYARYCLDTKTNWDKGMEAVERSISINENSSNLRTKAELLAQSGKVKDAIAVGEKAIKVGKAGNPKFDPSALEKLIEEWK